MLVIVGDLRAAAVPSLETPNARRHVEVNGGLVHVDGPAQTDSVNSALVISSVSGVIFDSCGENP